MVYFWRILPFFIEIVTRYVWSIVTMNNSIRIEHRNHLENKIFSQLFTRLCTSPSATSWPASRWLTATASTTSASAFPNVRVFCLAATSSSVCARPATKTFPPSTSWTLKSRRMWPSNLETRSQSEKIVSCFDNFHQ